ncbi:bifunctional tetrahydrofolate synthase/dihydrofolate synthase [Halomonas halocynthiae]|uniref:bifunctional tetrahydrofolate synthase/dihydrofolate synthase n=1 Tax=Halomonas halocynthiae TaxID=176290 RepID=UPI0005501B5D|nr:bifunctional tetrahydrofolate synthase/dihydrofolate synthase [Halomonas halocynthiae]
MQITLEDWLRRLESAHPVEIDLGLERVAEVAHRMGLLDSPIAPRVITVAGTNGKGSTVAMLEAVAQAHGLTTASYTSPHLLRYNERLRLCGEEASDALLIEGFEAVGSAQQPDPEQQYDAVSLSYFEVSTLGALHAIRRQCPDVAILEVGLGGRLDAVNVIDSDVAIVTTIARDHSAYLGDDLLAIGREKAGIMRKGRPAVLGSESLPSSVTAVGRAQGALVSQLGVDFTYHVMAEPTSPLAQLPQWSWRGFDAQGQCHQIEGLPDPGLPLDNAATSLQALHLAGVGLDVVACHQALAKVELPGRMQWLGQWCLDVAHNPHAAKYVARRLEQSLVESGTSLLGGSEPRGRVFGVLGMLDDKDADGVIDALAPVIDAWLPVSLGGSRGRQADELAGLLEAHNQQVIQRAESPLSGAEWLAQQLTPADRVLVCGSFLTVADVLDALQSGRLSRSR